MAGSRKAKAKAKAAEVRRPARAPRPPREDPMIRQATIAEIVALLALPAHGVSLEVASTVARRVVRDHPSRAVPELVPVILGHLERLLVDAA